jgi:hypothetical protein
VLRRQDVYSSLPPLERIQYVNSQYNYTKQYRTIIISGFKNIHIDTIVVDEYQVPLTIKEWILTIPDYNNKSLFVQVVEITDHILELQVQAKNLPITNKWARHFQTHISRVLHKSDLALTFKNVPTFSYNVEFWEPPEKPNIQFIPNNNRSTTPKTSTVNRTRYYIPKIFKNIHYKIATT